MNDAELQPGLFSGDSKGNAQDGRGIKGAAPRASEFLRCLAARIHALCALEGPERQQRQNKLHSGSAFLRRARLMGAIVQPPVQLVNSNHSTAPAGSGRMPKKRS